jgi:uncharacterized membrane protein
MMCIIANDVYLANDVYFAVILVIACIFCVYAMNSGVYTVKFEFYFFTPANVNAGEMYMYPWRFAIASTTT